MQRTWTPRVATALAVLAAAAFIYVTAEIMPVGALPAIARDLHVSEAVVGTLLASYALVAAVATMPLVRWTAAWPRRRTLLWTLACLSLSQLISALAPTFEVLAVGRVLCALTHGLMWSVIAPIGVRLVPPSHAGRATMAVYVGTGLALVVGSPLTAAMSELWGWRLAVGAITVASVVVLVAARFALPVMTMTDAVDGVRPRPIGHHRNRPLVVLSVLTLVGVTAHFISYTFIAVVIRDVVGVHGAHLAWLLAAYGIAGLTGMAVLARPGDRRPKTAVLGCLAGSSLAFAVLATLGYLNWHTVAVAAVGAVAIVGWGATANAMPPMLQAAAMRHSPEDPDGASGLYVACFQVGIMAGSLTGGLLYQHAGVPAMLSASAGLMLAALVCVMISRGLFAVRPATSEK
ncbi:MFS transporter [Mycobacterium crocinum]|uniref:MFS transporter n=1 Tax=Mycolicibacterium crocinum TaxID=388459 RepID=A0ABY3TT69_9MYCO|nr:MFS transporter [Mycolicibacterium crocinum]MCV7216531.1 MFS transporter [Mycolicibacterium crocinum]ULN44648.1 MFS transporter [Mycolicibacterium crocinum]